MSTLLVTPKDDADVNQLVSLLASHGYHDLLGDENHVFKPHVEVLVWVSPFRCFPDHRRHYTTRAFEDVRKFGECATVNELARHLRQ